MIQFDVSLKYTLKILCKAGSLRTFPMLVYVFDDATRIRSMSAARRGDIDRISRNSYISFDRDKGRLKVVILRGDGVERVHNMLLLNCASLGVPTVGDVVLEIPSQISSVIRSMQSQGAVHRYGES
jgi:hypothetical protein